MSIVARAGRIIPPALFFCANFRAMSTNVSFIATSLLTCRSDWRYIVLTPNEDMDIADMNKARAYFVTGFFYGALIAAYLAGLRF